MVDLQFAVRKLEREFSQAYYLEVWDWVQSAETFVDKLAVLYKILNSNRSEWSGGQSATNLEESIKRGIALDIMNTVLNQMRYEEIKNKEVV